MLASLPDGTILWCNEAFELLTGYTVVELQRIGWQQLTDDRNDLASDIAMAIEVEKGVRSDYNQQKQYKSKNGPAKRVVIHVLRNPPTGDFECYFVSVIPLDTGYTQALEQIDELRTMMLEFISQMTNQKSPWESYWAWVKENKFVGGVVTVTIAVFLLGDRLFEIIREAMQLFGIGGGSP